MQANTQTSVYAPTSEGLGRQFTHRGYQLMVVKSERVIHGPLFPNTAIRLSVTCQGRRGKMYRGYVTQGGTFLYIGPVQ